MIPNLLSTLRIALCLPLAWLLLGPGPGWPALALLVLAGATDVLDGWLARRLSQASRLGAMLDLIGDRLTILVVLSASIANDRLAGYGVAAALVLLGREVVVAAMNEALPGRLHIRVTLVERLKIACQFAAMLLLAGPQVVLVHDCYDSRDLAAALLAAAALVAVLTLVGYGRRATRAFRIEG